MTDISNMIPCTTLGRGSPGSRLSHLLRGLKMTQVRLAELLEISQDISCDLCNDKIRFKPKYALAIERSLRVRPEWILQGDGDVFIGAAPTTFNADRAGAM